MIISVLTNKQSWIVPYAERLLRQLDEKYKKHVYFDHNEVPQGDCLIILGYEKILSPDILARNKHNLVVHESSLPQGKGWSPLTWQVLEGKNNVPIILFEADESVDGGDIYYHDMIELDGHELIDEIREKQGNKTIELVIRFFMDYPNISGSKQIGSESFYQRRRADDSELEIDRSLKDLFNKFRIVDNERYPAFFRYKGHKYLLKICKDGK
jgi:methionyl-tRNA formyltransferase